MPTRKSPTKSLTDDKTLKKPSKPAPAPASRVQVFSTSYPSARWCASATRPTSAKGKAEQISFQRALCARAAPRVAGTTPARGWHSKELPDPDA